MIKFRSLTNPTHIKSILGERAYRRVRASGVAFDLSDAGATLRNAKYAGGMEGLIATQKNEHCKVWAKEHEEDLAKYSKLIRSKAPTHAFTRFDSCQIGGRGESEARRILAIKIPSKWESIVHTKWYIDEDDTAHRFLLPSVMAELDHYLTLKWYEILADQDKTFANCEDNIVRPSCNNEYGKTGGAGFIFRRARSLPRLRKKVLAWFGGDPIASPELGKAEDLITPNVAEDLCSNEQYNTRAEYNIGGYGEFEIVLAPKWDAGRNHHSKFCEWQSGASVQIDATIDIRDHKGRALARKIASLLAEAKKEVSV
ncbi:MAG: hypothetical protein EBT03_10195 [Betaproteobacteria bacterium]|nr:hypothetical protein [Betaproteobacteria bacterium]